MTKRKPNARPILPKGQTSERVMIGVSRETRDEIAKLAASSWSMQWFLRFLFQPIPENPKNPGVPNYRFTRVMLDGQEYALHLEFRKMPTQEEIEAARLPDVLCHALR